MAVPRSRCISATANPSISIFSASYFDDGNLRQLADEVEARLVKAAADVDLDHLPLMPPGPGGLP